MLLQSLTVRFLKLARETKKKIQLSEWRSASVESPDRLPTWLFGFHVSGTLPAIFVSTGGLYASLRQHVGLAGVRHGRCGRGGLRPLGHRPSGRRFHGVR